MPIYTYECVCGHSLDVLLRELIEINCECCGEKLRRIIAPVNFHIAGNPGPKIKTRVNLDDELKRQGMKAPLFKSEEAKDKARWALKKHSLG